MECDIDGAHDDEFVSVLSSSGEDETRVDLRFELTVSIQNTRLFHLRLHCILIDRGIFIVKTMGAWLVYFVDFQQNKCLKN